MNPLLLFLAVSTVGVEVGWEPLPDGGYEYTIQIEPQLLDVLKRADEQITSLVPPHIDVRSYRLVVGTGKLPRIEAEPRAAVKSQSDAPPFALDVPDAPIDQAEHQPAHSQSPAEPHHGVPDAGMPEPVAQTLPDSSPAEAPATAAHSGAAEHSWPAEHEAAQHDSTGLHEASEHAARNHSTREHAAQGGATQGSAAQDNAAHEPLAPEHQATQHSAETPAEPPALPELDEAPKVLTAQAAGYQTSPKIGRKDGRSAEDASASQPDDPSALQPEVSRPWPPFLIAMVLLCCSLAANVFLGIVARDARNRYREAVSRFRTAPAA